MALAVSWVRGLNTGERYEWSTSKDDVFSVTSVKGQFTASWHTKTDGLAPATPYVRPPRANSSPASPNASWVHFSFTLSFSIGNDETSRFRARLDSQQWLLFAPHWALLLTTASAAVLIKPAPRWRFSLRDLFVFSTLAALVLGAFEIASKLTSEN